MAQYTKLSDDDVRSILTLYGFDLLSVEHLPGGAMNSSYVVEYTKRSGGLRAPLLTGAASARQRRKNMKVSKSVLTVLDGARNVEAAQQNGKLLRLLECWGVSVDGIIPLSESEKQLLAFVVTGEDRAPKPIMLRRWVEGRQPNPLDGGWLHKLGSLVGSFKSVPYSFYSAAGGIQGGRRIPADAIEEIGFGADPRLVDAIRRVIDIPEVDGWDSHEMAICHGDLFPDNIIQTDRGSLVAIDWELASIDSPVLDLGIALAGSYEAIENTSLVSACKPIARGYESSGFLLTDEEKDAIGRATMYGIVLLAYRRYVVSVVMGRDPRKNWHEDLIEKFEELRKQIAV